MKSYNYKNFTIHHFLELASTNDKAFQMASSQQISDSEIILADLQSAGKGRMDRNWISPFGNLYFSLLLKPKKFSNNSFWRNDKISEISFVAIVALRLSIQNFADRFDVKLMIENKWPNDLLINGKKIAGLLLESSFVNKECNFVVVGIGVNIVSNPHNVLFAADNLENNKIKVTPNDLLESFLDNFAELYQKWQDFGFNLIRNIWLQKAWNLHNEIIVNDNNQRLSGIFSDIDQDGNLILETPEGRKTLLAADIYSPNLMPFPI